MLTVRGTISNKFLEKENEKPEPNLMYTTLQRVREDGHGDPKHWIWKMMNNNICERIPSGIRNWAGTDLGFKNWSGLNPQSCRAQLQTQGGNLKLDNYVQSSKALIFTVIWTFKSLKA